MTECVNMKKVRMPQDNEFHTEGAVTLDLMKQRLCGHKELTTDLVLKEHRERAGMW